jgi:hypothetical protein
VETSLAWRRVSDWWGIMRGVQQKKIRLNTNDLPAFLDCNHLHTQFRAFDRDMDFPFLGIRTSPDLVRYRDPTWPADRPSQVIDIYWSPLTVNHPNGPFRSKLPYFICPHCKLRRVKLFDAGGFLTCRACCNLRYRTQQVRRRAQLFIKAKKSALD